MDKLLRRYEINMNLAKDLATLSTCDRAHVGAVVYQPSSKRIVGMGYNGALPGHEECDQAGHLLVEGHCVRTLHAEDNALEQAKENAKGSILFVTHFPCIHCTKDLIRAGVSAVVYDQSYRESPEASDMLQAAGVTLHCYDWIMSEVTA